VRGSDSVGIASASVVLHLISPDTTGEIDTLRAGPTGEFTLDLPTVPDPVGRGEVYLASVTHQGVVYFGPPIHQAAQLDSLYLVQVHDTAMVSEGGASLPLLLRYLILEPAPEGWMVTDVMQVENTGQNTLVAPEGEPVWRYPLPVGATDLEAGAGTDVSPEAITLNDGTIEISAPITPGVRQFMVRYRLERARLDVPLPGPVRQVELLVPEPAPPLSVTGLSPNAPAEMDVGVTYRRFSAVDVRDGRVLVLPGVVEQGIPHRWFAVMMGLMLSAVALWAVQRERPQVAPSGPEPEWISPSEQREKLLLEVATIDERLEGSELGNAERAQLTTRREGLLDEVRRLG
jgi:hypothetical protein